MNDNFRDPDPDDNFFNEHFHSVEETRRSNYYSISNFNNAYTDLTDSILLCNYNIRSFHTNFNDFEGFLQSIVHKFNLIVLTETRFTAGGGWDIPNYTGYHVGRCLLYTSDAADE